MGEVVRRAILFGVLSSVLLSQIATIYPAHSNGSYKVNNVSQSAAINSTYSMSAGNTYSFDFTGTSWGTVMVKLWGGGGGSTSRAGGAGGYVEGILNVGTFRAFTIVVGGAGLATYTGTSVSTGGGTGYYSTAGYNGGGRGLSNSSGGGNTGGGGGATDLRLNLTTVTDYANANRILVAAGGGGATDNTGCTGGAGGYPSGSSAALCGYGGADGGTQSAGGSVGGSFGRGGENISNTGWNGGGGGGWYGGGAQKRQHGGGAGGSSYYDSGKISSFTHGVGAAAANGGSATLTILTSGDTVAPIISSSSSFSVNENQSTIATLTANETSTWSIVGGNDSATVNLNPTTGALSFKATKDFESPADSDGNNAYLVTVRATDLSGNASNQAITVTIVNINEPPNILSNGGGETATITLTENSSTVTTAQASDPDAGTTLIFSLSGTDGNQFTLNASSGVINFRSNPDFEIPLDSNADNQYLFNIVASDGNLFDTQTITVIITDVTEIVSISTPLMGSTATKGISISVTSTVNVAGRATFYVTGKKIPRCIGVSTVGSTPFSVSCLWKPSVSGRQVISFIFRPSQTGFLTTSSPQLITVVGRRTGNR